MTVAVLLAVALFGYVSPKAEDTVPARVVLDNSGGRVIFSHAAHAEDYGYECVDCHHDEVEDVESFPADCGSCHPKAVDEKFAKEHKSAFPSDEYCIRCHFDVPGETIPEDDRPYKDMILTRADAFHGQCMGCHEAEFAGPFGEDSCSTCHASR